MVYQKIAKSASSNPKSPEKSASIARQSISSSQTPIAHFHNFTQIPVHSPVIQAKLTIGAPNDRYEQEADRVASQVVQQLHRPASIQRSDELDETIQTKSMLQRPDAIGSGEASTQLSSEINNHRGGGQPLDIGLQQSMGQAMGADFSMVRVHTDGQSDRLNRSIQAKAFTTGHDIFFRQGEYNLGSRGGQELIAHELTHIMQQRGCGTGENKIQRSGVKSELKESDEKFKDFQETTKEINDLRNAVAQNLYHQYKPTNGVSVDYNIQGTVRDKSKKNISENFAKRKAQGLNHWSDTAINSALRIYAELESATDVANNFGLGYHDITLGINTDTEADVTVATYANEVKRIDSPALAAVDKHVTEGSVQLAKRVKTPHDQQKVKDWILKLEIANSENSWPYTPAKLKNLIHQKKPPSMLSIQSTAGDRILKYENSKATVKYSYWVNSKNPYIGEFKVRV
jgi:hypothetical protein